MIKTLATTICLSLSLTGLSADKSTNSLYQQAPNFVIPKSLKAITPDYRKQWHRLSDSEFSGLHWQQFVVIYSNIGQDVYNNNYRTYINHYINEEPSSKPNKKAFTQYPEGTIIIKESFANHTPQIADALTLTIMIKHPKGFDSANGDWEYLQTSSDGRILLRGKADDPAVYQPCGECHKNMKERDYIFSTIISKP